MHDQPFTVGRFERIYDPSEGEAQKWYINDHTIARDHTGLWHLIGITHEQIDIPPLEQFFNADRSISADEIATLRKEVRASAALAKREGRPWFDAH